MIVYRTFTELCKAEFSTGTSNSMLTQRQKQILEYIKKFIKERGYSPTLGEIGKHFRLPAKSGIYEHLEALEEKGYITRAKNKARSIQLVGRKKSYGLVSVPLLGTIAAGEPIEAIENKEYVGIPKNRLSPVGEFYALRVVGNSMIEENINDGDIVVVKRQATADNGQKVVALVDNSEATLKKFYREKNGIRLQPANSNLEPIAVRRGERNIQIQGVVVDILQTENLQERALPPKQPEVETPKIKGLPLNEILCGDAVKILLQFPADSIDLVVTSPPYDLIRSYHGFSYDLHRAGEEIYRVLKPGGIAVMVIQDQTKNFGKTLTSFRTIVDWVDTIGFKLFETVIYKKYGAEGAWWNKRFRVDHEYMPVFLKGERPQYFTKEHLKVPSKHGGKTMTGGGTRLTNGVRIPTRSITINAMKCRGTVWEYLTAGDGTRLKHQHPATFPDKLPEDFIRCFCPEGGIVLDPYIGSGTTAVAAKKLGRNYIGIDIAKEYCELARKRIDKEAGQNSLRLP